MKLGLKLFIKTFSPLALIWFLGGTLWIVNVAPHLPLDIDEAGYFGMSVDNCFSLERGGVFGFLLEVMHRETFAPLQPFLGTVFGCTKSSSLALFIPLIFSTLFLNALVKLSRRGWVGAAFIACSPFFAGFSISFQFAMLVTSLFGLAIISWIKSNGFSNRVASLKFGAYIGLALLSRTMFVAFFVVTVVLLLAQLILQKDRRKLRLSNYGLAIFVSLFIAAPWYLVHFRSVFGYLVSFGYGSKATQYGSIAGIFRLSTWSNQVHVLRGSYLPNSLAFIALLIILVAIMQSIIQSFKDSKKVNSFRATIIANRNLILRHVITSNNLLLILIFIGILSAMASSRNQTSAGELPALVPVAILLIYCFELSDQSISKIIQTLRLFICVCLIGLFAATNISRFTAEEQIAVRGVILASSQSPRIPYYENQGFARGSPYFIDRNVGHNWQIAINQLGRIFMTKSCVAFAFRHSIANVNSVTLAARNFGPLNRAAYQIDPFVLQTQHSYDAWVSSMKLCSIATSNSGHGQFEPLPNAKFLSASLSRYGYSRRNSLTLPDGQLITFWDR